MWAFVITLCPLSSASINFLHFDLFLWNHWEQISTKLIRNVKRWNFIRFVKCRLDQLCVLICPVFKSSCLNYNVHLSVTLQKWLLDVPDWTCEMFANRKFKMAHMKMPILTLDPKGISHFNLLLWNHHTDFNKTL